MEGPDGEGPGKSFYALGDKRCPQFGTCETVSGFINSQNNNKARVAWTNGRDAVESGDCVTAMKSRDEIISSVKVPLIQGTLREAYEVDENGGADEADGLVEAAEGWAFASSVLPFIAECDPQAAEIVRSNVFLNESPLVKDGFRAVKTAIESTYECLGLSCTDVGAMATCGNNGDEVCPGMEACKDASGEDGDDSAKEDSMPMVAGVLGWACFGALVLAQLLAKLLFQGTYTSGDEKHVTKEYELSQSNEI